MKIFRLLLLSGLFLVTTSLKDFEHLKERTDRERPHRPPLYELAPVSPNPIEGPGGDQRQVVDPSYEPTDDSTVQPLPKLSPSEFPQNKMPPEQLPYQGMLPKIERQIPLELQDEGNIMSHHMPQRNPGPSSFDPRRPRHSKPRIPKG